MSKDKIQIHIKFHVYVLAVLLYSPVNQLNDVNIVGEPCRHRTRTGTEIVAIRVRSGTFTYFTDGVYAAMYFHRCRKYRKLHSKSILITAKLTFSCLIIWQVVGTNKNPSDGQKESYQTVTNFIHWLESSLHDGQFAFR